MKKGIIIAIVLLSILTLSYGSNAGGRPRWISELPVASNNTFEYKVVAVNAGNIHEARGKVPQELTYFIETTQKVQVSSVTKIASENIGGEVSSGTSFNMMAIVEGNPVNVVAKIIDEYQEVENGREFYYFLCAVGNPKASSVSFDKVQITDKYGTKGLWRSAVCPGWGQMYKGSKGKGLAILGAEVAALGGVVAFEGMRSSYVSKRDHTMDPRIKQKYQSHVSTCKNIRNGFIAGAAAVYVYNLIDAIAAPGSRWLKTTSNGFAFYPSATDDFMGLTVTYQF